LHGLGFASPLVLLVLLGVPVLLALVLVLRRRRSRYTVSFTNLGVLGEVAERHAARWRRRVPLILLVLALALEVGALARPHLRHLASDRGTTVILLVDVSGSMDATDIYPTRLRAAVDAMSTFVEALPKNDKVGLITFSDKVEVVDAPTTDHAAVESGLGVLTPEGGTALGTGVQVAVRTVVGTLAASGIYTTPGRYLPGAIVLESDGAQNRGTVSLTDSAELAKTTGVRIYGVALGTRHGYILQGKGLLRVKIQVPPDPGAVALLARESGGQAFAATDAERLDKIYRDLGDTVGRQYRQTQIASWFELAAALLLVGGVAAARLQGPALP
jgi:Ca-activated chloride channel family protein